MHSQGDDLPLEGELILKLRDNIKKIIINPVYPYGFRVHSKISVD